MLIMTMTAEKTRSGVPGARVFRVLQFELSEGARRSKEQQQEG